MRKIRFAHIYLLTLAVIFLALGAFIEFHSFYYDTLFGGVDNKPLPYPEFLHNIFFLLGLITITSLYFIEKKETTTLSLANMSLQREIDERKRAEQERIEKEKLQGIIEMSGAVCHELNQPMQVVSGTSVLLMMNIQDDNPLYENIKTVKEQIDRMGTITKKLMGITKYITKDYLKGKIIDIDKATK